MKRARTSRHASASRPAGAGPSNIKSPYVETTPVNADSLSVPATDSPSVICNIAFTVGIRRSKDQAANKLGRRPGVLIEPLDRASPGLGRRGFVVAFRRCVIEETMNRIRPDVAFDRDVVFLQ